MIKNIQNKNQVKEIMYRGDIYMEETQKMPIREVGAKDKEYPEKLRQYTGMPEKLYIRGNFSGSGKTDSSDCRCAGGNSLRAYTGISVCEILK